MCLRSCTDNKAQTNLCSYYFQSVVNFPSQDGDGWILRVLLCVLEENYWSLLPLVSVFISCSAHESVTAQMVEMTPTQFAEVWVRLTSWSLFPHGHSFLYLRCLVLAGSYANKYFYMHRYTVYQYSTIVIIIIIMTMMLSGLWHFSSRLIC